MDIHNNKIKISIIIPFHNEEKFIGKCLESVLLFNGLDQLEIEILLIDGKSTDRSREIIEQIRSLHTGRDIQIANNPTIIQAAALNIGINKATGDYLLRLDAHSSYPENYLEDLLETSLRTNAENVGGVIITKPYSDNFSAQLVQALTTHKFGVGNSGFRVGAKEGPADTVPYGFFKKSIFRRAGFFDERLIRAQDYEFNRRIAQVGGTVWINPDIQLLYYNQPDLFSFLKKQLFKEAPFNSYMWYLAPYTFNLRHSITGFFSLGIIVGGIASLFSAFIFHLYLGIIIFYLAVALLSSVQQALRYKKVSHIFCLPLSFFLFHFLHGIGIIAGCLNLLIHQSPVQINIFAWDKKKIRRYTKEVLNELKEKDKNSI
jgi:glycosyltransferase involved in cell wall biosynthesis